jgi:hypothetical protein
MVAEQGSGERSGDVGSKQTPQRGAGSERRRLRPVRPILTSVTELRVGRSASVAALTCGVCPRRKNGR